PGMYTDTSRPNHLVLEVVDNSVDEALRGFCHRIEVVLKKDGSIEVSDDGRGMPVDVHPDYKLTGVELILTRLHAGGKFTDEHYQFSGGLHGVGVSVVNALSKTLVAEIKRDGKSYRMRFKSGKPTSKLQETGTVGKRNTGTVVTFVPDPQYFDTDKISLPRLQHALRAKAILCPGLTVRLVNETAAKKTTEEWHFEDGIAGYLKGVTEQYEGALPEEPFYHEASGNDEAAEWAIQWLPEGAELVAESYVNLIPTPLGGTHVNGLRSGLTEAMREFCEFRDLLPRGVKLAPEDLWDRLSYVISAKMREPQFSGQTKERLSSRQCAAFISGVAKDAFSLWLNQHTDEAQQIAELAIHNAQRRVQASRKVARKKVGAGPALPGKLADCSGQDASRAELFLVEGDSAGGS
ncbi:MAG: ATP-binding protein, partial [Gammaproteobacteria bacterium]